MRFKILKDPVSWATHFAGFLASVVGLIFLVVFSAHDGVKVAGMSIYGASLVVLFGSSAIYHFFDLGERGNRWLRRLDHSAIFFLIAGTYVPVTIHLLDGVWRISILSIVGGLALAGMLFKMLWIDCPAWIGTSLYLGLGWLAVIPAYRIFPQLESGSIGLLVAGGLAYTVGALVFIKEWPDPWPRVLGHHEIWHLFVLAGATSHFFFTWDLMGRPIPAF